MLLLTRPQAAECGQPTPHASGEGLFLRKTKCLSEPRLRQEPQGRREQGAQRGLCPRPHEAGQSAWPPSSASPRAGSSESAAGTAPTGPTGRPAPSLQAAPPPQVEIYANPGSVRLLMGQRPRQLTMGCHVPHLKVPLRPAPWASPGNREGTPESETPARPARPPSGDLAPGPSAQMEQVPSGAHRRPTCPPAFRRGPSAALLETGTRACQRNLRAEPGGRQVDRSSGGSR